MTHLRDGVSARITENAVRDVLRERWGLADIGTTSIRGGMNSAVWRVEGSDITAAVKAVPRRGSASLLTGIRAAAVVEGTGIPSGAAIPTTDGEHVVAVGDTAVALLRWVSGRPLDGTGHDALIIGRLLGRAHRCLTDNPVPNARGADWVNADAPHLDIEPWLRPIVRDVLADQDIRGSHLTAISVVHGDPAPAAFLRDGHGTVGLIDWSSGFRGPALYDLASALMYLGPGARRSLIDGYRDDGPLTGTEIDHHLHALLRFRWMVQADYFARRIAEDDLTGIDDRAENIRGLHDARRALLDVHSDR